MSGELRDSDQCSLLANGIAINFQNERKREKKFTYFHKNVINKMRSRQQQQKVE